MTEDAFTQILARYVNDGHRLIVPLRKATQPRIGDVLSHITLVPGVVCRQPMILVRRATRLEYVKCMSDLSKYVVDLTPICYPAAYHAFFEIATD
jgi:hypothetical protein